MFTRVQVCVKMQFAFSFETFTEREREPYIQCKSETTYGECNTENSLWTNESKRVKIRYSFVHFYRVLAFSVCSISVLSQFLREREKERHSRTVQALFSSRFPLSSLICAQNHIINESEHKFNQHQKSQSSLVDNSAQIVMTIDFDESRNFALSSLTLCVCCMKIKLICNSSITRLSRNVHTDRHTNLSNSKHHHHSLSVDRISVATRNNGVQRVFRVGYQMKTIAYKF